MGGFEPVWLGARCSLRVLRRRAGTWLQGLAAGMIRWCCCCFAFAVFDDFVVLRVRRCCFHSALGGCLIFCVAVVVISTKLGDEEVEHGGDEIAVVSLVYAGKLPVLVGVMDEVPNKKATKVVNRGSG